MWTIRKRFPLGPPPRRATLGPPVPSPPQTFCKLKQLRRTSRLCLAGLGEQGASFYKLLGATLYGGKRAGHRSVAKLWKRERAQRPRSSSALHATPLLPLPQEAEASFALVLQYCISVLLPPSASTVQAGCTNALQAGSPSYCLPDRIPLKTPPPLPCGRKRAGWLLSVLGPLPNFFSILAPRLRRAHCLAASGPPHPVESHGNEPEQEKAVCWCCPPPSRHACRFPNPRTLGK